MQATELPPFLAASPVPYPFATDARARAPCGAAPARRLASLASFARAFAQAAAFFFFLHRAIHARALRPRTLAQMSTSRSDAYNAERERTREKRRSERSREVAERAHKHEHVSVNGMWQRRKKVKRGREECY